MSTPRALLPGGLGDLREVMRASPERRELWDRLRRRRFRRSVRRARLMRRTLLRHVRVVVVVGSFGKTTTARATQAALGCDPEPRIEDNEFQFVSDALLRTPPWRRHAVIEVGIGGPGQMRRYARFLRPDVVVVTSIGSEHHRSLGSLERTREEKAVMLSALRPGGIGVFNGDDPHVRWMLDRCPVRRLTYGFDPANDVVASDLALDWPRGMRLRVRAGGDERPVALRLLGEPMARCAIGAIAVALAEGRPLDAAIAAVERLAPTRLRLEPVLLPGGAFLLRDEFKSTLETIHAALDLFETIPARRKLIVIGDVSEPPGGSQGDVYRALGARMARIAERVVVVGDGRRRYVAGARAAGLDGQRFVYVHQDLAAAAIDAGRDLGPGDVVLLKGRDVQRLDRVALRLLGHPVACELTTCRYLRTRCDTCAMAATGWRGRRAVLAAGGSSPWAASKV